MKFNIIFLALFLLSTNTFSQKHFLNKGEYILNLGVGFGNTYLDDEYPNAPEISFSGEVGLFPTGKIGLISLGGIAATKSSSYTQDEYKYSYTGTTVQLRALWHLYLGEYSDFDIYAGLGSGLRFNNNSTNYITSNNKITTADFAYSGFLGARWMATNHFGIFGEFGYDALTLGKAGISYKF